MFSEVWLASSFDSSLMCMNAVCGPSAVYCRITSETCKCEARRYLLHHHDKGCYSRQNNCFRFIDRKINIRRSDIQAQKIQHETMTFVTNICQTTPPCKELHQRNWRKSCFRHIYQNFVTEIQWHLSKYTRFKHISITHHHILPCF